jgi:hypothetical protein
MKPIAVNFQLALVDETATPPTTAAAMFRARRSKDPAAVPRPAIPPQDVPPVLQSRASPSDTAHSIVDELRARTLILTRANWLFLVWQAWDMVGGNHSPA